MNKKILLNKRLAPDLKIALRKRYGKVGERFPVWRSHVRLGRAEPLQKP